MNVWIGRRIFLEQNLTLLVADMPILVLVEIVGLLPILIMPEAVVDAIDFKFVGIQSRNDVRCHPYGFFLSIGKWNVDVKAKHSDNLRCGGCGRGDRCFVLLLSIDLPYVRRTSPVGILETIGLVKDVSANVVE